MAVGWLIDWLSFHRLIVWLNNCLIDWLIDLLLDCSRRTWVAPPFRPSSIAWTRRKCRRRTTRPPSSPRAIRILLTLTGFPAIAKSIRPRSPSSRFPFYSPWCLAIWAMESSWPPWRSSWCGRRLGSHRGALKARYVHWLSILIFSTETDVFT